jgi:LysR family glycine cleavage system transcriptional activator
MEANAAFSGAGVAMMTPLFWRDEIRAGRLVQLFDHVHVTDRSYWLVYPEGRRNQPKIAAFRDWMLAQVARDAQTEPPEFYRLPE